MKFTILLKSEDDSSPPLMVSQIERTGPMNAANLGLTLAESKCLLARVQQEIVESQFQSYLQEQRICTQCGSRRTLKAYHTVCFKSLFGGVSLRIPRLNGCLCEGQDARARTVKIDGLVNWVSLNLSLYKVNWQQ